MIATEPRNISKERRGQMVQEKDLLCTGRKTNCVTSEGWSEGKDTEWEGRGRRREEEEKGNLLWVSHYLHGCQLNGGDVRGVNHRLGPVGSVRQQALPLLRQPRELLLPRVEARVDAVLEVRGSRDLQPFLLLPKHAGKPWRSWKTKWGLRVNILRQLNN